MSTEKVFFQGKAKWARLVTPDTKFGDAKWSVVLYLNAESLSKFNLMKKEKGLKNRVNRDDDGDFVTFSRKTQKLIRGQLTPFAPPQIVDKEDKPFYDPIGNGSDITVKCDLYSYNAPDKTKGYALRLAGVRIDHHIPFVANKDFNPDEQKQVAGLSEQPEQLF